MFYLATIAGALTGSNEPVKKKKEKKAKQAPQEDASSLNVEISWETVAADSRQTALVIRHKSGEYNGFGIKIP